MNANLNNVAPLPSILHSGRQDIPHRRNRIGDFVLPANRVDGFNRLLSRLDPERTPIDGDQVASAARALRADTDGGRLPTCLLQRLRRAAAIERMVADRAWEAANDAIGPASLVVDYVRSGNDLIPDALPRIGRLDDAIVVDTAWPTLSAEVTDYVDFCRVRSIEAAMRGSRPREFTFTRADWLEARQAEAAWMAHCVAAGRSSYVGPPAPPMFHVC